MTRGYFKPYSRWRREVGRGTHSHQELFSLLGSGNSPDQGRQEVPLPQDDSAHSVQEGAVFSEQTDGLVEGCRLGVLANGGELSHRLRMVDPLHSLFDDGALIKVDGDEVGRCTNELDPAGMGLAVRVGPLEAGQEGMVNVDAPA